MTTDVADANSLQSWQEAFQHPIPTVRRFEQDLRRDVASNKDKLRSLVGVRYRELLGTAQTIVEMNDEIQEVETNLSNISRRCNPRLVEKKLDVAVIDEGVDERAIAAQLALLHRCTSASYRLFRKHSSNLLIAKLLVISRLLHKTLSQNSRAPIFLENLRSQLAALRRSLLKRIECRLASPKYSTLEIIETMSAYCLATSSSSTDVLRHFQQVRFDALQSMLLREDPNFTNIEKSLKLFIQTLQNASELVSGSLSDALRKLTALPILDDLEVRNLDGLAIDIFHQWVANDIRNFTPWVNHTPLSELEAEKTIKDWSKQAFGTFASGLSKNLERSQNLKEVLLLRRNLLDIWLPVQSSTACHSSVEILQGIRGTVNKQLISTLHAQAKGLTLVGHEISSTITSWSEIEEQIPTPSLWDPDIVFLGFSGGATNFKHEIINRSRGRDINVLRISRSYTTWLSGIEECKDMIDELKKIRWEDIIEDEEDEEVLQKTIRILNKDDPDLLQKEYEATLINSFEALQTSLHSALENMTGSHCGRQAAFVLRVIREIRERIPRSLSAQDHLFADDLVPKLHDILAAEVGSQVSPYAIIQALGKPQGAGCAGRALWEGNPPLPIQPSPAAFRLLRGLATAMERQGPDLWNPSAVDILKNKLRQTISSCISLDFEKSTHNVRSDAKRPIQNEQQPTSETPNGDDSTEATVTDTTHKATTQADVCCPEVLRDRKIQLVFDVFYLGEALSMRNTGRPQAEDHISSIVELVKKDVELDGDTELAILESRAHEYWKQTQLLFGLLI
ncbi:Vps51 superfamily domain-containing protein [Histoplasma ohiense]|nr:Vps51 superfamily domain-containing protein [Histoplasma ohiense (nom. inval.)]